MVNYIAYGIALNVDNDTIQVLRDRCLAKVIFHKETGQMILSPPDAICQVEDELSIIPMMRTESLSCYRLLSCLIQVKPDIKNEDFQWYFINKGVELK